MQSPKKKEWDTKHRGKCTPCAALKMLACTYRGRGRRLSISRISTCALSGKLQLQPPHSSGAGGTNGMALGSLFIAKAAHSYLRATWIAYVRRIYIYSRICNDFGRLTYEHGRLSPTGTSFRYKRSLQTSVLYLSPYAPQI